MGKFWLKGFNSFTRNPNHKSSNKKIFLVSDDNAYNYLFDFLGTDYINKELTQEV